MNLEGLLTYFGFLAAALAIMGPVQRNALGLFIPKWVLPISTLAALVLLVFRDMPLGIPPIFGWRLDLVSFCLTLGAFLIPVIAALWSWSRWHVAKLTKNNMLGLELFFEAALRESEFAEVERVLRKNRERLVSMPAGAASVLFHPRMVKHLMSSHSVIHLELLANRPLFESLENRLEAVEVVVREMISAPASPIQSAVVSRYGGIEHLVYTAAEKKVIGETFQDPNWYHDANAHYPLTITAINKIQSGELDGAYNRPDDNYVSNQGVARRATCPIYLAVKTEVLAIEAALEAGVEKDFYISDLFDIMRNIFERSRFLSIPFSFAGGLQTNYTPYSYLLEVITGDLEVLSEKAVQMSVKRNIAAPDESSPDRVGADLVRMWSFCIWLIMSAPFTVDTALRERIVERYFRFLFALGGQPSEILDDAQGVSSLNRWRDALLREFKQHLTSPHYEHMNVLKSVFKSLDFGKPYISEGYDWLRSELPKQFLPD